MRKIKNILRNLLWRFALFEMRKTLIIVKITLPFVKRISVVSKDNEIYLSRLNDKFIIDLSTLKKTESFYLKAYFCIGCYYFSFKIPPYLVKTSKKNTLRNNDTIVVPNKKNKKFELLVLKNTMFSGINISMKNSMLNVSIDGVTLDGIDDVLIKRRDNNEEVYNQSSKCDMFSFDVDMINDTRWDFFAIVNGIKYPLRITPFKLVTRDEDRYLARCYLNKEKSLEACIYLTEGSRTLSLWGIDSSRLDKVISFSKGKTIYYDELYKPVTENLVFFESFFGKNYSGQPKYIYEYLKEHRPDLQCVWSYNKDEKLIPNVDFVVERGSLEYYRLLARAKYWVGNIVFPIHKKRNETIYLQTWHGTPLKRLGYDIDVNGPEVLARENFYLESRNWDYLISQNAYSTEIFKRAFKYKKEILEYGYPHNDIFFNDNTNNKTLKIKSKLNLPKNKKIILYAPTWRDNLGNSAWEFDFGINLDFDKLYDNIGEDYIFLIRGHHLVSDFDSDEKYSDFIYNVSDYDDVQELSLISDILITDYSSVFFDYSVSRKPILFYVYDYEEYKNKLRGFYLDMEHEMPGPLLYNQKQLTGAINNISEVSDNYAKRYNDFINKFNYLDNGQCAKKIVEAVF